MHIPIRIMAAVLVVLAAVAAVAGAANKEIVRFRCQKWKAAHFKEAKKADEHYAIMKSIGCEVKHVKHDGHVDVKYRCPKWRQLTLRTHAEAHGWEKWLKHYGFQTQHKH